VIILEDLVMRSALHLQLCLRLFAGLRRLPAFQPHPWNSASDFRWLLRPPTQTVRSTFDSRLRSIFRLAFGTQLPAFAERRILRVLPSADFQLAPSANLPASPSNLNLRFSPAVASPTLPSNQPRTCVSDRSSSLTFKSGLRLSIGSLRSTRFVFQSAFDLRLQPTFRLSSRTQPPTQSSIRRTLRFCLPIGLQLAPSAHLPALPSNSTSNLHRPSHPPASPSVRPSTRVSDRLSSSTSDSTSDFHRWISSGGAVNQLPTCVGY